MPQAQMRFPFLHAVFAPLCQACKRRLAPGQHTFCRGCVRFFLGGHRCRNALFEHRGPAKGFLNALRGSAPERAAAWALALLQRRGQVAEWRELGVEIVLHAPQNARATRSGLALLAEGVAQKVGALYVPSAFHKIGRRTQHGRSAAERMDTEIFLELARPAEWIRGKQALVIDDVHTTGTTLDQCAFALRRAGASKVRCYSLAAQEATEGDSKESLSP
jgi:predicted amidophosphoribosyltransferase